MTEKEKMLQDKMHDANSEYDQLHSSDEKSTEGAFTKDAGKNGKSRTSRTIQQLLVSPAG